MSGCPAWFPRALVTSPLWRAAEITSLTLTVLGGPHHLIPVPGGPELALAFFQGMRVLGENRCDALDTSCAWVREQRGTIKELLKWEAAGTLTSALAGPPGVAAASTLFSVLKQCDEKLAFAEQACAAADVESREHPVAESGTGPLVTWNLSPSVEVPLARNLDGNGVSSTARYQRAYLSAARETWRVLSPTEDLRPWLIAQTAWDLDYLRPRALYYFNVNRSIDMRRVAVVQAMLNAWQRTALTPDAGGLNAPGPWSPATVQRVLSQKGALSGLIPDGVVGGGGAVDNGGGGGSGLLIAGGVLFGLKLLLGGR